MGKKNSEGYMDLTPYFAIRNAEGERMDRKGQVWWVKTGTGKKKAVVFNDQGDVCNVCLLYANPQDDESVRVRNEWASPRIPSYVLDYNFMEVICKATEQEMIALTNAIQDCLQFPVVEKVVEKVVEVEKERTTDEKDIEIAKVTAERDIYKDLFEKVMAR